MDDWFGGLQLSNGGTQTINVGPLPDQSELHGALAKIRDLGLRLTRVPRRRSHVAFIRGAWTAVCRILVPFTWKTA